MGAKEGDTGMIRFSLACLVALGAAAASAQDQKRDKDIQPPPPRAPAANFTGTYSGMLSCQEIRGVTRVGSSFPLTVVVTGTEARYEREFMSDDGRRRLGVFERGTGTVAGNGDIVMRGTFNSTQAKRSMTVEYRGKIEGGRAKLSGTQRWTTEAGQSDRTCSMDASKS
jgi:hypothetical protein